MLFLEPRDVGVQEQELFSNGSRLVWTQGGESWSNGPLHIPWFPWTPCVDELGIRFPQFVIGKIVRCQYVHRTVSTRESVLEYAVTAR